MINVFIMIYIGNDEYKNCSWPQIGDDGRVHFFHRRIIDKMGLKVMMMISNLKHRMVIKLKICRDPIQPLTPLTKLYCEFKHPADSPTNIRRFLTDTIA